MTDTNPINILQDKFYKIKPAVRWCFFSILISGFVFHFASMTQKYFNYFEMGNIFSHMPFLQGDTLALGRWFLPVASNLFTYYSMPVWNTVLVLCYTGLAMGMVVDLMDIKSRFLGVMFGLCFASFPGIVCVLSYGVNSDDFSLALLLAVLSAYLVEKTKFGVIWGAIPLSMCLAAYQPYMSVTIGVIYCILFAYVIDKRPGFKQLVMKSIKAVAMMAAGFILYYAILKICMSVTGIGLSDYHGVDSMTSFTIKGIVKGIVYAYIYLLRYFLTKAYLYSVTAIVAHGLAIVAFVVLAVKLALSGKKETSWVTLVETIILIVVLPIGVNASPVLMADRVGAGVDRYMLFSLMLIWALLVFLLDRSSYEKGTRAAIWVGLAAMVVTIFVSNLVDQKAYYRMDATTQSVEAMMNRLAMRIEETPGWRGDMPVCLIGSNAIINDNYDVTVEELESVENMPGTFYRQGYSDEAVEQYFRVFLHFPMEHAGEEIKQNILKTPEYRKMKTYPDASSIKIINDTLVVKFEEE